MEYKITAIPINGKTIAKEDKNIIDRALTPYQVLLDKYEKRIELRKDEIRQMEMQEKNPKYIEDLKQYNSWFTNFQSDNIEAIGRLPSIDDVKVFVYTAWAETIARMQTPYICDGKKKKNIRKRVFKDVRKGKFLNKKVKDKMNEYINRMQFYIS